MLQCLTVDAPNCGCGGGRQSLGGHTEYTDCLPAGQTQALANQPLRPSLPTKMQMLDRILNRGHLTGAAGQGERPYAESGVGYEVVAQIDGSGLLKGVE